MYVAIAVAATYRWGFVAVASFYYFAPALAAPLGVPVFCPPFLSFASAPHVGFGASAHGFPFPPGGGCCGSAGAEGWLVAG